jgi:SAM-dependent methyltransferase
MRNPWLDIPELDYVGHMSSPTVNQRWVLSRLMGEALESVRPRTMLVLGCSTGNGLEHVNPEVTSRVTVVDLNPTYLLRLGERFPNPGFELDVQCADLADAVLEPEAFDLVHAGLVLEYVEWPLLLPRVASTLKHGGVLSVVLQLPSASSPAVTPTTFVSLRSLESLFHIVAPEALVESTRGEGHTLSNPRTDSLAAGKAFEVLRFVKHAVQPGDEADGPLARPAAYRQYR